MSTAMDLQPELEHSKLDEKKTSDTESQENEKKDASSVVDEVFGKVDQDVEIYEVASVRDSTLAVAACGGLLTT